jgi:hypothetical protein
MIVIDQRDKNVYRIARFVHFLIEMYTILMIHLRLGPRQRHEASLVPDMAEKDTNMRLARRWLHNVK